MRLQDINEKEVDEKFSGMINAFRFGAPPHGGIAPGVDRMVMLLADEPNIREVVAFPMNQKAQDLMMKAPAEVSDKQLKELHLKIVKFSELDLWNVEHFTFGKTGLVSTSAADLIVWPVKAMTAHSHG